MWKVYSRVWINRVRLPVLLVVNWTEKNKISLSSSAPENLVSRVRVVSGTRYMISHSVSGSLLYLRWNEKHVLQHTGTVHNYTVVVLQFVANCVRRALSFRWRASYWKPTPYSSDARTQPFSTSSPVIPRRSPSNRSRWRRWASITSSTASKNSLQICCSGGHRTTTAARAAIAQLLQLRKPSHKSHNYCCSGGHRTTAAPAAIAPALLHQPPTVLQNLPPAHWLNAIVSTSQSWLGRRCYSFLWRTKLVRRPTKINPLSVGRQGKTAPHKNSQFP